MNKLPRLLILVSVASFALGAVVSRVLFVPGGAESGPATSDEADRGRKAAARLRAIESNRWDGPFQIGEPDNAKQPTDNPQADRQDPISTSASEVRHAFQQGARIDAVTANRLLKEAPSGTARRRLLHRIAQAWVRQDPESAAAWANELEGADRQEALRDVLHRWTEDDPAAAATYLAQLPTSEQNLHIMHAMAHRWAERDRTAAMAWGAAQTSPANRERAMGGVVSSWAESDPQAAAKFAAAIESPYERQRVLDVAARRWAAQDAAAAVEWAQGLPDEERQRVNRSILHELAEIDPRQAAAVYKELTGTAPADARVTQDHRRMAEEIASVWSSSSPREAAAWAAGLPEAGEVRRSAVGNVAEHWLRIDSMEAGKWILQLPEGATRDAAAERVVRTTVGSDPAVAFEWANSLSDEGHRSGLIRDVVRGWSAVDAASARAALGKAKLSPQQLREISVQNGLPPP
jgi:hypothetical protein